MFKKFQKRISSLKAIMLSWLEAVKNIFLFGSSTVFLMRMTEGNFENKYPESEI